MPDPIPFPQHRRAAGMYPEALGQPAGQSPPSSPAPAVHPSNVVSFPIKETALGIPTWCPVPPYVGSIILGITLAAAAAICIGMDAVVGGWRM